jgi:hypothetical protein
MRRIGLAVVFVVSLVLWAPMAEAQMPAKI